MPYSTLEYKFLNGADHFLFRNLLNHNNIAIKKTSMKNHQPMCIPQRE